MSLFRANHSPHFAWMYGRHEDLTVQEIELEVYTEQDEWLLTRMDSFKGLKSLSLILFPRRANHPDPLSILSCPKLEHLALSFADPVDFTRIDAFPELKSLYVKGQELEVPFPENASSTDYWNVLTALKDRNIFFFADYPDDLDTEEAAPMSYLYMECLNYVSDVSFESLVDPIIEWLTLSTFYFAEFYGQIAHPGTAVEIDLRALTYLDDLLDVLELIKSMHSIQQTNNLLSPSLWIWLRPQSTMLKHKYPREYGLLREV
jgi:hypothetical protein